MGKSGLVALVLVVAACGSTRPAPSNGFWNPEGDAGVDAGSPIGGPCAHDTDCGTGGTCIPETSTCACGGQAVKANLVPPNLLVVLDRSCSMKDVVTGTSSTKWQIAVAALKTLLTQNMGHIQFGLELFPDKTGDNCTEDGLTVAVGPNSETTMLSILQSSLTSTDPMFPSGPCVTPIDTAMKTASTDPSFADASRRSYAILITDGEQAGCAAAGGNAGTLKIVSEMRTKGVDTFVVGFGSGVNATFMNSLATSGGQPQSGTKRYYTAVDQTSLDAALGAIAQHTLACSLRLSAPPPNGDESLVYVYVGDGQTPLARDATHAAGWDYDAATQSVSLYGADCDALKAGTSSSLHVVFGCPGAGPPPNIH